MSEIYRVFMKHKPALRRLVRRHLAPGVDAEDVLQEAFVKAYAAELKNVVEHPKPFLFQVARNTALADLRRSQGSPIDGTVDFEATALPTHTTAGDGTEALDSRRKLRAFTMAVVRLPPKCRKAFLLRRMEGLSYKQIANRMGISVSAAEKHVALGLVRCHAFLVEQGYEPDEFGRTMDGETMHQSARPGRRDQP
ncbi:MAG: RNA polymerase sigma factor [Pseudomonadales bacterium]|jgi:RNA polymerase sigma-70 factor (ECF subfamily)|nr:RNA polymerase sigma factor [Pseudomonadales bacterium]